MTNANANNGPVISTIEGNVTDIVFKDDRNGKEFVTVSVQQDGLTYPTNVRSRDAEILRRMVNAKKHWDAGTPVSLRFEVRETPRSEGGVFRDITRILRASLNGTPQEPGTEDSGPTPATAPASTPASWTDSLGERIAWNSAVNNAVSAVPYPTDSLDNALEGLDSWLGELDVVASFLYPLIRRGPLPPAEDAPEPPVQAPEPNVDPVVDAWDGEPPFTGDEEPGPEVFEI